MGKVSSKGRESENDLPLIRPKLSFGCMDDDVNDDISDVGWKSTHVNGTNFEMVHPRSIPNAIRAKFLFAIGQELDDRHHNDDERIALLDRHEDSPVATEETRRRPSSLSCTIDADDEMDSTSFSRASVDTPGIA